VLLKERKKKRERKNRDEPGPSGIFPLTMKIE
jgi:hypothetical protein